MKEKSLDLSLIGPKGIAVLYLLNEYIENEQTTFDELFEGLKYIQQVKTKTKQTSVELINQKDFIDRILSLNIVSKDYVYSNELNASKLVAESFGKLFGLDQKF